MLIPFGYDTHVRDYNPYKNAQFAKKMDKARTLLKSIDDTSLRENDKKKLKNQIMSIFS